MNPAIRNSRDSYGRSIKNHLRRALHKGLILDLEDRVKAEAVKAFEMIRDHSGLDKKRAREAEGQARFG